MPQSHLNWQSTGKLFTIFLQISNVSSVKDNLTVKWVFIPSTTCQKKGSLILTSAWRIGTNDKRSLSNYFMIGDGLGIPKLKKKNINTLRIKSDKDKHSYPNKSKDCSRIKIDQEVLPYLNFSSECLSLNVAKYCSVGRLLLQYAWSRKYSNFNTLFYYL